MSLPTDATWNEYVAAHGGMDQPGWWIMLDWMKDWENSDGGRTEVFGPYKSTELAEKALQSSPLICGICEDTKAPEILDEAYTDPMPFTIQEVLANFGPSNVTLIDPTDPDHFGGEDD